MSSYRYRISHCGDKTVVRSSYLHNGISYTDKMISLYRISPLAPSATMVLNMHVRWTLSLIRQQGMGSNTHTISSLCNPRNHCTHSLFQDYCIVKLITPNRLTYLLTGTTLWRRIVLYALVPKTMHGIIVGKRVRTRRLSDRYCTRV